MHLRFLIEDPSGKILLEQVLPKILAEPHTYKVMAWQGIGHLPSNLRMDPDPRKRTLLDKLPRLLQAAGKEFANYDGAVIVIVDVDGRDKLAFLEELDATLAACDPKPKAIFRLAIEEGEAWLLGDRAAVKAAYPNAKDAVLNSYFQDSICGTWEVLADAIHPGGRNALSKTKVPYSVIGAAKCEWARKIGSKLQADRNASPSFQTLLSGLQEIIESPPA